MQWIQDQGQMNVDNLNNERRDACRHFRKKKKAYRKVKTEDHGTNSKFKYIRTCIGASMNLRRVTSLERI